jgi:hypothetical protein
VLSLVVVISSLVVCFCKRLSLNFTSFTFSFSAVKPLFAGDWKGRDLFGGRFQYGCIYFVYADTAFCFLLKFKTPLTSLEKTIKKSQLPVKCQKDCWKLASSSCVLVPDRRRRAQSIRSTTVNKKFWLTHTHKKCYFYVWGD